MEILSDSFAKNVIAGAQTAKKNPLEPGMTARI
jgi:hypothetical protein